MSAMKLMMLRVTPRANMPIFFAVGKTFTIPPEWKPSKNKNLPLIAYYRSKLYDKYQWKVSAPAHAKLTINSPICLSFTLNGGSRYHSWWQKYIAPLGEENRKQGDDMVYRKKKRREREWWENSQWKRIDWVMVTILLPGSGRTICMVFFSSSATSH